MWWKSAIVALFAVSIAGSQSASGGDPGCRYDWSPSIGPGLGGASDSVRAMAVFDDGTGPALFAAGTFETAGGVTVSNIAKWDGTSWSALVGPSGTGVDDWVYALEVFDDGTGPALYVGGLFETAGGITVNGIARWDGTDWSALSSGGQTGVSSTVVPQFAPVNALEVHDSGTGPALYAGGNFTDAGGQVVNRIAKWDGSSWSALSGGNSPGTNNAVRTIYSFNGLLYVGGGFTTAGGQTANQIANWNGSSWSAMSTGLPGLWVNDIVAFDDGNGAVIYAAGDIDGAPVRKWNGTNWSAVVGGTGTSLLGDVEALIVHNDGTGDTLYASGDFNIPGGSIIVRENIARWDGQDWHVIGNCGTVAPDIDESIDSMVSMDGKLLAGGKADGPSTQANSVIQSWGCHPIPCPGDTNLDGIVNLLDLNSVLANFGQASLCIDTTGDGQVDIADLNAVLANFGTGCD